MTQSHVFEEKTNDILIRVSPKFLEDESAPDENRYVWSYTVKIENQGSQTVQLLTRYWRITDKAGRIQEVEGNGVVGKTPVIKPGDVFEYTSGAPLSEPSGLMQGVYGLSVEGGGELKANVPLFALDSPYDSSRPN